MTPFQGAAYYTAAGENTRAAVNRFIRTGRAFDEVIDFAHTLHDPTDPLRLRPTYDSGDHLHPNNAGHAAIARSLLLEQFE